MRRRRPPEHDDPPPVTAHVCPWCDNPDALEVDAHLVQCRRCDVTSIGWHGDWVHWLDGKIIRQGSQ